MNYENNYNNTFENTANTNTQLRIMYAPNRAYLVLSRYKSNLSLRFGCYKDVADYNQKSCCSTTIDYESAAGFYYMAMSILYGSKAPIEFALPCSHDACLYFNYEPNEEGEMQASLTIKKKGVCFTFPFEIHRYRLTENGQKVFKEIHTGLLVWAKMLDKYLMESDAERYLCQMQDEGYDNPMMR